MSASVTPSQIYTGQSVQQLQQTLQIIKQHKFLGTLDDLLKLLKYVILVVVIVVIIYIVTYILFRGYPRFFSFGHTESSFQKWVEESWFQKVVEFENNLKDNKNVVFFNAYKVAYKFDMTSEANKKNINFQTCPGLFIMLMFFDEIGGDKRGIVNNAYEIVKHMKLTNALGLQAISDMYRGTNEIGVVKGQENEAEKDREKEKEKEKGEGKEQESVLTELSDQAWDNLKNIRNAFNDWRSKTAQLAESNRDDVNLMMLNLYLNVYFDGNQNAENPNDNIKYMYKTRQIGGFANFTLFRLYMSGYVKYVFELKIKKAIWSHAWSDITTKIDQVNNFLTSDTIMNWFTDLPSLIAKGGKDGFTNGSASGHEKSKIEHFREKFMELASFGKITKNPYANDVQENFIQYLIKIAETFMAMLKVITGIVDVMNDPLAFIRYLIGIIIASILLVVYIILVAMQLGTIIGFLWVVFVKIFETVLWTILFVIFAIIYGIIAIIDIPLGGAIMGALRCENMPDAWSKTSNFHRLNLFQRTFFCSSRCRSTFYPSGIMCKRQSKDEPVMTPQQIIYNMFLSHTYLSQLGGKTMYSHTPPTAYYMNYTQDQKKKHWKTVYEEQSTYFSEVATTPDYKTYDSTIQCICKHLLKESDGNSNNGLDEETQGKLKKLCQQAYCRGSSSSTSSFAFCQNVEEEAVAAKDDVVDKNWWTLVKGIVKMICVLIAITIAMVFIIQDFYKI
jgi:hypothetical protein